MADGNVVVPIEIVYAGKRFLPEGEGGGASSGYKVGDKIPKDKLEVVRNPSKVELWNPLPGEPINQIECDSMGNFYIAKTTESSGDTCITKLSPTGEKLWKTSTDGLVSISVDADGYVVADDRYPNLILPNGGRPPNTDAFSGVGKGFSLYVGQFHTTYINVTARRMVAYDAFSGGNDLWTFNHDKTIISARTDMAGNSYILDEAKDITKISIKGKKLWTVHIENTDKIATTIAGNVYAISLSGGAVKKITTDGEVACVTPIWFDQYSDIWTQDITEDVVGNIYVPSESGDGILKLSGFETHYEVLK